MKREIVIKNVFLCLLALLLSTALQAQKISVSGTVVDDTGASLPGVSIVVKGTSQGVVSSIEGDYQISVDPSQTLIFSFIGFETEEVAVNGRSLVNVTLFSIVSELEQVVVVGYGSRSVRDVTGSIGSVNTAELVRAPVPNFDQALAGQISGVQVQASDGQPGSQMQIVIRGGNSITGDNSPLYVIDGIPMEDFNSSSINTNDIASFDVLKDASATAIYGSRGANGVIIINTKSGREGPTQFTVKSMTGVQWIPNRMDVLDPYDFVKLQQEVAYGQGGNYVDDFLYYWGDPELYRGMNGVNWQDKIYQTARIQNHNISMSGGSKRSRHYISLDYLDQEGTMIHTGFTKYNGNFRFDHEINDWAKVGARVNYNTSAQVGENVSGNNRVSILKDAITFRPVGPLLNDDGLEEEIDLDDRDNLRFNPVKTLKNTHRLNELSALRANLNIDLNLTDKITFKTSGGYVSDQRREEFFQGQETLAGLKGVDGINGRLRSRRYHTYSNSNVLDYTLRKNGHRLILMGGHEIVVRKYDFFEAHNTKMPIDNLGVGNLSLGTAPKLPVSNESEFSLLSYFGRIDYALKDRYLITATYRTDGSSRFLGENRWGYFPSVALAWRVNEEAFMSDLNFISNMKLRGGWGATGNNRVGDFSVYTQMDVSSTSGYVFDNEFAQGVEISNVADVNLKWETTYQTNVGLDLDLFGGAVSFATDWYRKETRDLLLNAEMSPSTGINSIWTNVAEISNEGFEFSLSTTNVNRGDFRWNSNFNISTNKNRVEKLNEGQDQMLTNPDWYFNVTEYQYITRVGQPVGQIYGLEFDGLYQIDDFVFVNGVGYQLKEGIPNNGGAVVPGSVKFVDQDGNGTIDGNDRVVIGDPTPKHFGGFRNDFVYKGFDLSVFFQWSYGNDILNANRADFESPGLQRNYNYYASVADRYSYSNPSNDIHIVRGENAVLGVAPAGNKVSSRIVEDGSFLRLKTVSVGYQFDRALLKRYGINRARLYLAAQNLYTWTNYSGYDPEVSVGKFGALTPGLDYSAYPISSTVSLGLELTF